ncbi:hypothetical protein DEU56DRAFT_887260 [Suillus clintonianus]|uniref:uncharacterized protein n=1 Tax=Suillus clintonianus TaxID=1904413 RepID=UPI001B85DB7B|nr:uncharacterized protein DEU56DRAFT_887260 [Suillus clintonianus]KAG2137506.1 hypothetical protein DEU56DRAFT_887260 [Suillus clintonianus]
MALSPLIILFLLHIPFLCASLPNLNDTSISALDVSESPSTGNTRSLWDIIWSCTATLFACTWTAIHPNIPGMEEGIVTVWSRRLGIMIVALIAPELIITWATLQFLSARGIAKDFNDAFCARLRQTRGSGHSDIRQSMATALLGIPTSDERNRQRPSAPHAADRNFREWTVTHGFFAWMGGFMLYVNDEPQATLRPDEILSFVRNRSVDVPAIVEADIEDRSKGDALSKGIAVLQLAWFVLQLVARLAQNLPMTLLEIDTLAVAALFSIAYGFWWKKPKDVGRPYAVHWKATSPPGRLAYSQASEFLSDKSWFVYLVPFLKPLIGFMGIMVIISPHAVREHRVPSLGGYNDHLNGSDNHVITLFIGCVSGMVFGVIHCLGWNVLFQGHVEQILWRAASLAIISTPASILLLFCYVIWGTRWTSLGRSVAIALAASFFIYIVARVTLVVLLLMSLRSLPPGVYDAVAWTKFFPHF